jgi:hypothetical protein
MRTLIFAGVFLIAAAASAQPLVGPEVASDPLPSNTSGLTPPIALAHDQHGTVIAWVSGDEAHAARVFVARLDATNHVTGTVREMPIVSNNSPVDASPPAIAILDDRVLVAWLETLPPTAPYTQPRISTAGFALFDRDLHVVGSSALAPPVPLSAVIARAGRDRFWIVARDQIWWVTPDGAFSRGTTYGRVADDATVTNANLQIVARRQETACYRLCYTTTFLYVLTLYGNIDEQEWWSGPMNLPVSVRANDGTDVLLVWFAANTGGSVYAMRVPPTLAIRPGQSARQAIGTFADASRADIATDGTRYVVVWQTRTPAVDHDVIGASLEADGHIVPLPIATSVADEHDPSIVATGPGSFLVTYRKDSFGEQRIAGRMLTFAGRRRSVIP